jgi:hypothetical protein
MFQRKRWLVALAALVMGGSVSAAVLFLANPARDAVDVYVVARDLPAGATLGADSISIARVDIASGQSLLFVRGDGSRLVGMRASHDLATGQLIQRSDVMDATTAADRRLVFIPVKDVPAASPGSKVDLLVIGGAADHPTVVPFAIGVEVQSSVSGGLVVVVTARQAAAFVYAANAMRLVAVMAEPGAAEGAESPISSSGEAMSAAAGR